jgi:hypothetical protein
MALKYKTGVDDNIEHVSLAKEDMGLDVYLCASGPSLARVEDSSLHVNGALVAAVNNAYPHIRPDIWFGLDDFHCFHSTLWTQPFMKVVRGAYRNRTYHGIDAGKQHNTYYGTTKLYPGESKDIIEYEDYTEEHEKIFYSREPEHAFLCRDTCRFATSVLLYMGAKKIFLVGMDLDNTKQIYHDKSLTIEPGSEYLNMGAYKQVLHFYKWASEKGKSYGVEFVSCTQNSPINKFLEYIPLEDALKTTVKTRSFPEYNIVNARAREKERKPEDMNYHQDDDFMNNDGDLIKRIPMMVEGVTLGTPWSDSVLTIVDKMILFECDNVHVDGDSWIGFWQELIDSGVCWSMELPKQYARIAASMLKTEQCKLHPQSATPPDGWEKPFFLQGPLIIGYDVWDRPPTNPNWGRPFRWKQMMKARIKQFKDIKRQVDGGANLKQDYGCCKEEKTNTGDKK